MLHGSGLNEDGGRYTSQVSVYVLLRERGHERTAQALGSVTEEQFDGVFNLNTRGTLFTGQSLLSLFRDGGSIINERIDRQREGFSAYS